MNELFYTMIFKRKSFHLFRGTDGPIPKEELASIVDLWDQLTPLLPEIRTAIRIVPAAETTCKRGEEYCILLYSEKKPGYMQNIGYLGQQMDFYLASRDIGSLWFGIGKVPSSLQNMDGMDFVIMLAIGKMPADKFRKDMFKSKRKSLSEIWQEIPPAAEHLGFYSHSVGNIARFAPSACNSQPWKVKAVQAAMKELTVLEVYRYRKPGRIGIMPTDRVTYYNRIDMGIFLLFLEVCMTHEKIEFTRELLVREDDGGDAEETLTAKYFAGRN